MPKCLNCQEVYADTLRRCPHCGKPPSSSQVAAKAAEFYEEYHGEAPPEGVDPLGLIARRKRKRALFISAAVVAGLALAAFVALPGGKSGEELTSKPVLNTKEWKDIPLAPPDEIVPKTVDTDFALTEVTYDRGSVVVRGTCAPGAIVRVLVNQQPATLSPDADRFRARVPFGDGKLQVIAEGILGDTAKIEQRVEVSDPPPAGKERLLSHAGGQTVHKTPIEVRIGIPNGKSRLEETTLSAVKNRVGGVSLYLASQGYAFLRVTPEGIMTFLRARDEQEMVLVPGGVSRRGMGEDAPHGPVHLVSVSAYLIDRNEITCRQYAEFLRFMRRVPYSALRHVDDPGVALRPAGWPTDEPPEGSAELPVTDVPWYAAYAYARWVGGRLPTEAEWERAAAGPLGRAYPWGDQLDAWRCRANSDGPLPADSMPLGVSPYSLLHACGNVREWCEDRFDPRWYSRGSRTNPRGPSRNHHRVVRGGSFASDNEALRLQYRDHTDPRNGASDIGFRVVRRWVDLVEHEDR